jgi:hypothetical protein
MSSKRDFELDEFWRRILEFRCFGSLSESDSISSKTGFGIDVRRLGEI